jgi:RNA-splicing ligase RtcB
MAKRGRPKEETFLAARLNRKKDPLFASAVDQLHRKGWGNSEMIRSGIIELAKKTMDPVLAAKKEWARKRQYHMEKAERCLEEIQILERQEEAQNGR